ncbi:hypothetical protein F442_15738 [Phytophthora nicotianae P10297]|uniref:Uncharacterized protein n=5 Tax=Phytophthora nicotianae TaxID=4792 RepID=W2R2R7_PHYN3|nr:hypothetical protein PPTG_21483 [Phytophthora nicotianae INRA-310]ETI38293.1 hypothetical protein F443_15893 [Phytophthora nicotianae P1569]ETM38353.1 hypothetical protein L914_15307 [Phytophthora nicotianae]ETO67063.1 hypothetical protein F444_15877 [Phytophthora nicotianae P1976]ETP36285.1 hypothetical protein F442_15738 [Phytophthora nicotianae P10297]ETN19673.1 hypothetical protein PPTG_21483 [Phytophthora nicotianae INRA-310]
MQCSIEKWTQASRTVAVELLDTSSKLARTCSQCWSDRVSFQVLIARYLGFAAAAIVPSCWRRWRQRDDAVFAARSCPRMSSFCWHSSALYNAGATIRRRRHAEKCCILRAYSADCSLRFIAVSCSHELISCRLELCTECAASMALKPTNGVGLRFVCRFIGNSHG